MSIRVGRCFYENGKRVDPSFPGFTSVLVLSKSASEWGVLGPYELRDEYGRIHENIWQFSKAYIKTRAVSEKYPLGRYGKVVWEWPAEEHITKTTDGRFILGEKYGIWRQRGLYTNAPVRYPNSKEGAKDCVFAFKEQNPILPTDSPSVVLSKLGTPLDYIQSRKQIYLSEYLRLVRAQSKYSELKERFAKGENLLIIEVDGPHQESLDYYQENHKVEKSFIQDSTMLATKESLKIMLNDPKHPFGHGYCLALSLLEFDDLMLS